MKKKKHDYLSNIIMGVVLITALLGMYFVLNPAGRAVDTSGLPSDLPSVDMLGDCCCASSDSIFTVQGGAPFRELTAESCELACAQSSTSRHPVTSLGPC